MGRALGVWLLGAATGLVLAPLLLFTRVSLTATGVYVSWERTHNATAARGALRGRAEEEDSVAGESGRAAQNEAASLRLPDCLIIGVRKGGTRALQHFLATHPNVTCYDGPELNFFGDDAKYERGLGWYSGQLPGAPPDCVLLEKTADYFQNWRVPARVRAMRPSVKLVLVVRDPVERLVSDYHFLRRYAQRHQVEGQFLETQLSLEELLINASSGGLRYSYGGLYRSKYSPFFANWLRWFPRQQFHVMDGDTLAHQNPAVQLKQVEAFLGLPPRLSELDFYLDEEKGFWCLRQSGCLSQEKGHQLPALTPAVETKVRNFFRAFNRDFYNLTGIDFGWK